MSLSLASLKSRLLTFLFFNVAILFALLLTYIINSRPLCSVQLFRRLPKDVLRRILVNLRQLAPPHRITSRGSCQSPSGVSVPEVDMLHLGWIFATQVCREWRKVALGCKTLWTYIDPAVLGEEWSREMLRRSNGVPLTLRHTSSSLIHGKLRKFTLKLPTRPKIRALEIDLERFHVANDPTLDQLEKTQPHLERLEFHAHESVPTIDRSDYFRMPLTWLGGRLCTSTSLVLTLECYSRMELPHLHNIGSHLLVYRVQLQRGFRGESERDRISRTYTCRTASFNPQNPVALARGSGAPELYAAPMAC